MIARTLLAAFFVHAVMVYSATGESDQRLLNYIIYFRNVIYILIYDIKIGWSRLASKLV